MPFKDYMIQTKIDGNLFFAGVQRKIRSSSVNLLSGRSIMYNLYPLIKAERPFSDIPKYNGAYYLFLFDFQNTLNTNHFFPAADLIERLTYGELPGIVCALKEVRNELLKTYSLVYIKEEIRREASIEDLTAFSKFIQLAAIDSENMLNYATIAKDAAVTIPTIKSYFQLLEEMFISFKVPAFSGSSQKRLLSTGKSFFFDLGVRHASAGLKACYETVLANPGPIFEQWVGVELWKRLKYTGEGTLYYMRITSGGEIDYIIDLKEKYIPIEVKWTEHPDKHDAKHLESFIKEHKRVIDRGFIICRCKHAMEISQNVLAIPWGYL